MIDYKLYALHVVAVCGSHLKYTLWPFVPLFRLHPLVNFKNTLLRKSLAKILYGVDSVGSLKVFRGSRVG